MIKDSSAFIWIMRVTGRMHMCDTKHSYVWYTMHSYVWYGVATISKLLKIIGLFCRISSLLWGSFAKETYNCKEPTNRRYPIWRIHMCGMTHSFGKALVCACESCVRHVVCMCRILSCRVRMCEHMIWYFIRVCECSCVAVCVCFCARAWVDECGRVAFCLVRTYVPIL